MCYGCVSGDYKGLTIVTIDNVNYQNLDENDVKNFDKNIINKVSSIHNIPIEYLFEKEKFVLLEPFLNIYRLVFIDKKNEVVFDKDDFIIEPQTLSEKLALFQNLEELLIFGYEGGYLNNINYVFVHEDKMLIFDGDSKKEKFINIPENIKYLNIIQTTKNLRRTQIEEIYDYNFLPNHIEELHVNYGYLRNNFVQTNLPSTLTKLKTNMHRTEKGMMERVYKNVITHSKIPFNCKFVITEYS